MKSIISLVRICVIVPAGVILLGSLMGCGSAERKVEAKERQSILDTLRKGESHEGGEGSKHGALNVAAGGQAASPATTSTKRGLVRQNVPTDFNPDLESPQIDPTAFVDPLASVIGNVQIGRRVYLAPFSSARGDEGQPIHIGDEANLQDGVVIHALETIEHGRPRPEHTYEVHGKRYAVYIGDRVSLAHQSHVHGPAWIEDDTFVGMQALVFKAHVGRGCVIEPAATVIGVTIPDGRYVPAGSTVTDQGTADNLPKITAAYGFRNINRAVVHVNSSLADGYSGRNSAGNQHPPASGAHGSNQAPASH